MSDYVALMQYDWLTANQEKPRWIVVREPDGTFSVHWHDADNIAPPANYPDKRRAVARLMQLLHIGPVAPQTHPETVCIGFVETAEPPPHD